MARKVDPAPGNEPPMPKALAAAWRAKEEAYAAHLEAKRKASAAMSAYLDALWSDEARAWRTECGVWLTGRAYMSGTWRTSCGATVRTRSPAPRSWRRRPRAGGSTA